MGHLMRSLSLADILCEDFDISFIIQTDHIDILKIVKSRNYNVSMTNNSLRIDDPATVLPFLKNVDIVILDFYKITEAYQLSLINRNLKVICIDDFHDIHFYAQVVINVSNSVTAADYVHEPYTKLLLGSEYALLAAGFLDAALGPLREIKEISSVFISMGAADKFNNSLKFLKATLAVECITEVHVMLGPVNANIEHIRYFVTNYTGGKNIYLYINIDSKKIIETVKKCQLAICPASGVSVELCAVGIVMISGYTADNQTDLLRGIVDKGCAISLNDFNLLSEFDIETALLDILVNKDCYDRMLKKQKALIDGKSPERIRKIFKAL